ncbi:hypothetical protein HS088_TW03G01239 [Tripterygium wilfordii]|uniref:DEAD-box ATP-dependent RNA helicase 33 n=1 Tax=Tripterygium wilfordii TaxID=458696 RepID=A0A7J7DX96_TRIWF|nr:translation initiation factor IF-2 [Tripterygium wilfordii]XP_038685733.1 translation initiation factor IF-2 [Tripterygium wilfordii]KAF5750899.1 hypothetical protein HS088_TW03G01239 [Tripterygium wilfordii]
MNNFPYHLCSSSRTSYDSLHNHQSPKMSMSFATCNPFLSFSKTLSSTTPLFLHTKFSHLSLQTSSRTTIIRMGGGPRTYPGGVSKWQWKRMQAKKAKQLLKARLARERQIYEMRKRAELKAAVSELERPWEVVEKAPALFSVRADEQVKVLADRFQKPGGFDMWTERDGPQLFETPDGIPSARFFPKGVVHSVKPYGKVLGLVDSDRQNDSERESKLDGRNLSVRGVGINEKINGGGYRKNESSRRSPDVDARNGLSGDGRNLFVSGDGRNEKRNGGGYMKNESRRRSPKLDARNGLSGDRRNLSVSGDGINEKRNGGGYMKNESRRRSPNVDARNGLSGDRRNFSVSRDERNEKRNGGGYMKNESRRRFPNVEARNGLSGMDSGQIVALDRKQRGVTEVRHSGRVRQINRDDGSMRNSRKFDSELYDMSLQQDGSYGFREKNGEF